jgi:FKBP-type peptidyl-prolyl cis-trans isomerase FklB
MRLTTSLLILASFFIHSMLHGQNLNNSMDSLSYSIGVRIASDLKRQGFEGLNSEALAKGINDVLSGNELLIDANQAMSNIQQYMQEQKAAQHSGTKNAGEKFLEENKKRPEVITLPSGLQYEVLTEGTGESPAATDKVTVHYHGTLIDGTVFDSSVDRGQPASFPVNGVIKGWVEALQLMKVGSKWKLFIPYDLAYGERAAGPTIKPYSTLVFEVELLEINN